MAFSDPHTPKRPDEGKHTPALESHTLSDHLAQTVENIRKNFGVYDSGVWNIVELTLSEETRPLAQKLLVEFLERKGFNRKLPPGTWRDIKDHFSPEEIAQAGFEAITKLIKEISYFEIYNENYIPHQCTSIALYLTETNVGALQDYRKQLHQTFVKTIFPNLASFSEAMLEDIRDIGLAIGMTTEEWDQAFKESICTLLKGGPYHKNNFSMPKIMKRLGYLPDIPEDLRSLAKEYFPGCKMDAEALEFSRLCKLDTAFVQKTALSRVKEQLEDIPRDASTPQRPSMRTDYALPLILKEISLFHIDRNEFRDELITCIMNVARTGNDELVAKLFQTFDLDPILLNQPPLRDSIRVCFQKAIDKNKNGDLAISKLWETMGQVDVLNEVIAEFLERHLKNVDLIIDTIRIPKTFLAKPDLQEKIRTRILAEIANGKGHQIMFARWTGTDIDHTELREACIRGACNRIGRLGINISGDILGDIQYFLEDSGIQEQDVLRDPKVISSAGSALVKNLEFGNLKLTRELVAQFELQQALMEDKAKKAAAKGFRALIELNDVHGALEFRKECNPDDRVIAQELDALMTPKDRHFVIKVLDELPEGLLAQLEKKHFLLRYRNDVGVPSQAIYSDYLAIVQAGNPVALTGFVERLKENIDRLISGEKQDDRITQMPHYKDLIKHVFPNHAGDWTNFKSNESCPDHTDDLSKYKIRKQYHFTVAPGADMELKKGKEEDAEGWEKMHVSLEQSERMMKEAQGDSDHMKTALDALLAKHAEKLSPKKAFATREEKIFGLILEQTVGKFPLQTLKEILISYQFAASDVGQYLQGTRGRAEKAKNPRYAYLLELHEFFADRLKDIARGISDKALSNPALTALLPAYFEEKSKAERQRFGADAFHRLQIDKLGLSSGFLQQIGRVLQKAGKPSTEADARALVRDYEERTTGLAEAVPADPELDRAIYGQIRAQRQKTIRALETLGQTGIHPSEIFLEDVHLHDHLMQQSQWESGAYDEELFTAYLSRSLQHMFADELAYIQEEAAKYQPKDTDKTDLKPKRVEAFISKNHTSAHARGTAGICTSGDNPVPGSDKPAANEDICQWDMPNYFQLVLRDGKSKVCQGCVLLHIEKDNDLNILTASFNPSSTYLFQVNEGEMFTQLLEQLFVFARDNDIDAIGISKNPHIRTNRTGGEFERAMDRATAKVHADHIFSTERAFSSHPKYTQTGVDFVWVKDESLTW